jgi:hypothetical protein
MHNGRKHIKTISRTHQEHRALDIRSKDWPEKAKKELVKSINKRFGHFGAVGVLTGERRVIIHERDAKHGEHFHVQVSKRKTVNQKQFTSSYYMFYTQQDGVCNDTDTRVRRADYIGKL